MGGIRAEVQRSGHDLPAADIGLDAGIAINHGEGRADADAPAGFVGGEGKAVVVFLRLGEGHL